jgi:DNA-binding NarL/FixJ family response regulator
VLIVDDHPGVRSSIEALIARTAALRVIGSVSSGAAAIEGVRRLQPTVIIMDLAVPGINGVEATRHTRSSRTRTRICFWKRSVPRLDAREASEATGVKFVRDTTIPQINHT